VQLLELYRQAGIQDIHLEKDGSISGETDRLYYYPTTSYVKGVSIGIRDGKIMIDGTITKSVTNSGAII